ncbi:MAG: hybrid sensor histidine kinase/response regulator, partial [Thiobacillus sp.]|nr:hybrid sensor histidine kinase/response regulator [Thiobacillus sp.]
MSLARDLAERLPLSSIRSRMLVIALLPAFAAEFGMVFYFTSQTLGAAEHALLARADNAARHLGDALPYALVSGDIRLAQSLLATEAANSQLAHARIFDPQGRILASQGTATADDRVVRRVRVHLPSARLIDDAPFATVAQPVNPVLGVVEVSVSRDAIKAFTRSTLIHAALLMLVALSLTGIVAWRLSGRLAGQLRHVGGVVARLARGDL